MANDPAGAVEEGDELGLHHLAGPLLHVGSDQGVGLPELVGVGLGEG